MPNYLGDKPHTEPNGTATFRFVPPGGGVTQDKAVTGALCRVTYRLAPGKPAATPDEVQHFYGDALGRLGAALPFRDASEVVAHFTAGGPEIWVDVAGRGEAIDVTAVQVAAAAGEEGNGRPEARGKLANPRGAGDLKADLDRDGRAALHFAFDPGQALLKPADAGLVDAVAAVLAKNPNVILRIEGHARGTGDPERDRLLASNRADALVQALTVKGIAGDRVPSRGAETFPDDTDPDRIDLVKQ